MKIHDEMSQISVPEGLDEKTHQSILRAEKTVQKNRFRKKCTWSVLTRLEKKMKTRTAKVYVVGIILSGDHFWNYSCYKPGNGRKYTDYRKCIYLYSGRH